MNNGVIDRRWTRLTALVTAMQKFRGEMQPIMDSDDASNVEKQRIEDATSSVEMYTKGLQYAEGNQAEVETNEPMAMANLKILAEKASSSGFVYVYGCAKCGWCRMGCIWWKCKPHKFNIHVAKFPGKV